MTPPPKLTLERWAEMDAAASAGPWITRGTTSSAGGWVETADHKKTIADEIFNPYNCELIAATRGAPTALLAALRGLAVSWDQKYWGAGGSVSYARKECAAELRALLRDLDLSAQGEAQ